MPQTQQRSSQTLDFVNGTEGPPVAAAALREAELQLGRKLDPSYGRLLCETNGGVPVKRGVHGQHGWMSIEVMLGVVPGESPADQARDLVHTRRAVRRLLPEDLLPFARLTGNDYLCFQETGGEPAIVAWHREESARVDRPVTEPVARSFDELVAALEQL